MLVLLNIKRCSSISGPPYSPLNRNKSDHYILKVMPFNQNYNYIYIYIYIYIYVHPASYFLIFVFISNDTDFTLKYSFLGKMGDFLSFLS